jgi:hypothetical protein
LASNLTSTYWNGQTLDSFLTQNIPANATIPVTGHSLGDNLATCWLPGSRIAVTMAGQPDSNTEVYTFAAPSAGNIEVADGFNARFPNCYRYWNTLDAFPRAWGS